MHDKCYNKMKMRNSTTDPDPFKLLEIIPSLPRQCFNENWPDRMGRQNFLRKAIPRWKPFLFFFNQPSTMSRRTLFQPAQPRSRGSFPTLSLPARPGESRHCCCCRHQIPFLVLGFVFSDFLSFPLCTGSMGRPSTRGNRGRSRRQTSGRKAEEEAVDRRRSGLAGRGLAKEIISVIRNIWT